MSSDLVFINTSGPGDSKTDDKRKAVRSQAAKDHSPTPGSKADASGRRRHRKLLSVQIDLDVAEGGASSGGSASTAAEPRSLDKEMAIDLDRTTKYFQETALKNKPGGNGTHPVDMSKLDGPGAKYSLRLIWFPMVINNQATLSIVWMFTMTHYVPTHQTRGDPEVLSRMKENAIASINRALKDPKLAISDEVIGAVAKMAAYEAGFTGDEKQYHIHMKGLSKMVELRGGLKSLGLNGLLARMLLFIDANGAFLLKTKQYFPTNKS
ncbi:MAG: hypothetical protein Q9219_002463 [cf. Caloplaca sp. 3 TL-2023]